MIQLANKDHFQVLVIGAGTGGVTVAARLVRTSKSITIGIIEPSDKHYYQPLWTLVGGGVRKKEVSQRPQASVIPKGTTWVHDAAAEFIPDDNLVVTAAGRRITYDFLVVAPGIQIDWDKIPGLKGNLGLTSLCSNYSYKTVGATWPAIQAFEGGTAIFTHPNTPIKCGGAPQKIMYLAADYWRKHPPKNAYKIVFCIAAPKIFSAELYAKSLLKVIEGYGIEVRYQHNLDSIDARNKLATFKQLATGEELLLPYSLMHVTPPMSAPDFIKQSPLSNEAGWVEADKHTLQHPRYSNIFTLGDASALPTSKTAAAIRKQAPTVVANLLASMSSKPLPSLYNGYTSCPLVTGYGKLIMAEFDYDGQPQETFPIDQSKERLSMYLVKKHLLPRLYWDGMLKGRA